MSSCRVPPRYLFEFTVSSDTRPALGLCRWSLLSSTSSRLLALDHDDLHPHTCCHFLAHLLQSTPALVLLVMLSRAQVALSTPPLLLGARVERRF